MRKRVLHIICFAIVFFMSILLPASTLAVGSNPSNHIIKVAYAPPEIDDLEFLPITQIYKAYLDEIAKYADWHYEMVAVPPQEVKAKLLSGEIDMALPIEYDANMLQNGFIYSEDDLFYDIVCFYARADDTRFGEASRAKPEAVNRDLRIINGAKVGLLNSRTSIMRTNMEDFMKTNHLSLTPVFYDSVHDMETDLLNGKLDLMADTITRPAEGVRQLMPFTIVPAHLATLSSKQYLMDKVNYAVRMARMEDIDTINKLKYTFMESTLLLTTHFTPEEWNYINSVKALNVVLYVEEPPFYTHTDGEFTGIFPDMMRYLSELTGLHFNYISAKSYQEAKDMLTNGTADLMIDIYNSGANSPNFYFTNPIYRERFAVIGLRDIPDTPDTIIVPHPLPSMMHYIQEQMPTWKTETSLDTDSALKKANLEPNTVALVELMALQSDRLLMLYPRLTNIPTASIDMPLSIAISKHNDVMLRSILNKGIMKIDDRQMEQIILRHTVRTSPKLTLSHILYHYPLQLGIGLCFIALVIAIVAFSWYNYRRNYNQKIALARKNAKLEKALKELEAATAELGYVNMERDGYKYMAEIDGLTNVYNKAGIETLCRAEFINMTSEHTQCAFLIIDLDHFKQLNDTCGHQKGDEVLKTFASALKKIVRKDDYIGRFGGDEFVILLKNITCIHSIERIATNINIAARNIDHGNSPHPITASIGIALAPKHALSYEDVFHCADRAVYNVKERGRNSYCIYSDELSKN